MLLGAEKLRQDGHCTVADASTVSAMTVDLEALTNVMVNAQYWLNVSYRVKPTEAWKTLYFLYWPQSSRGSRASPGSVTTDSAFQNRRQVVLMVQCLCTKPAFPP